MGLASGLKATDLIVEIVKKAGGDTYVSGSGADRYQDASSYGMNGIKLEYASSPPAEYKQRWGGFQPYMSALDRLFNVGGMMQ